MVNGCLGGDQCIGRCTCFKNPVSPNVIDYVIADADMIPLLYDFHIDILDRCLSDVHCPIVFHVQSPNHCANNLNKYDEEGVLGENIENLQNHQNMPLNWTRNIAEDYNNAFSLSDFEDAM